MIILSFGIQASAEEVEVLLHREFLPTAFGIKSRTIDIKDGELVAKAIENYKVQNPNAEILRIELQTCTSDYRLPQSTLTARRLNEHEQLAEERHSMIRDHLVRSTKIFPSGHHKVCGPKFETKDLNDRFISKESGAIYEEKFKQLIHDESFVQQLKVEALVDDPEVLKKKYPTIFLAKFKPFQGVRLSLYGRLKKKGESALKPTEKPSGKTQ
jgi:hypothetical protein